MEDVELLSALALNRIFGYTPKYSHLLLSELGSCKAVFDLNHDQLRELLGPGNDKTAAISPVALEDADAELSRLRASGVDFIPIGSESYPPLLAECQDAPMGLYFRSASKASEIFTRRSMISVVGTRDMSMYGKDCCETIVRTISRSSSGPTIVSGLALGVDITAHMAALASGIPTIAVLPCGIDRVYPARHSVAADKIAAAPGSALITDFPPGMEAMDCAFLRRNRIIAGMSSATILIESRRKGGGMLTSRFAADYGRDVFAVPGRIGDLRSEGCNTLICERLADPIISGGLLLRQLRLTSTLGVERRSLRQRVIEHFRGTDPDRVVRLAQICELTAANRGIDLNGICDASGLEYREAASLVMTLENEGMIESDLLGRCCIHTNFD